MARGRSVANIDACLFASKELRIEGHTTHKLAIMACRHKNLIKAASAIEINGWIVWSEGLCIGRGSFNEQRDGMSVNVVSATNQEAKPAGLLIGGTNDINAHTVSLLIKAT